MPVLSSSSSSSSATDSLREKLLALGDPSGQQGSEYWNKWFSVVCYPNNKDDDDTNTTSSFEWYCTVETVSQILIHYITRNQGHHLLFFHPGNGNSLLPFYLRDFIFCGSRHVIMDVSDLAIQRMQLQLVTVDDNIDKDTMIQFKVGNVLEPLSEIETNTVNAWVDKGLLDALFAGTHFDKDSKQCRNMMLEAHRILKRGDDFNSGGILLIVSMAQDHSLDLILENWLHVDSCTLEPLWIPHLHIHEVDPSSGSMRPFIFILQKSDLQSHREDTDTWSITFHTLLQGMETIHFNTIIAPTLEQILPRIQPILDTSRQTLLQQQQQQKKIQNKYSNHIFTKLEIKVIDPTCTDLTLLHDAITAYPWNFNSLSWHPCHNNNNTDKNNIVLDNLTSSCLQFIQILKYGYIQDIGYGISKLILACTMDPDDLDPLIECILSTVRKSDFFTTSNTDTMDHDDDKVIVDSEIQQKQQQLEDNNHDTSYSDDDTQSEQDDDDDAIIQSIDIDWDSTIPICSTRDLLPS